MLMEHETTKLKELDEGYSRELKEWKADLKPRKQVNFFFYYFIKYQFIYSKLNSWSPFFC